MAPSSQRIFLLSPANLAGQRARVVLSERASFDLAVKLRDQGAPLGEIYSFISGLYFRGKLAYVEAFRAPPLGLPGAFVITPGRGLLPPEFPLTLGELRQIGGVPIGAGNAGYLEPLARDARLLDQLA